VPRTFRLDVVTPDRIALSEDVFSLVAPGAEGSFGVLAGHAPMVAELTIGPLRYRAANGVEDVMAVSGGFLEVGGNHVTVLADSAERSSEIDVERARRARDRAREQLRALGDSPDQREVRQNDSAVQRAQNRLRIAGRE
jgi:F-type H+-transporting ATPase subunit epsilon